VGKSKKHNVVPVFLFQHFNFHWLESTTRKNSREKGKIREKGSKTVLPPTTPAV